jgi:hypothetical protein
MSNYLCQRDLRAIALLSGRPISTPQADQATQRAPKLALGSDPHERCLAGHPCIDPRGMLDMPGGIWACKRTPLKNTEAAK